MEEKMKIMTGSTMPNWEVVESIGLVWGSSIKAKHIGKDITMGLKHMVGGELGYYTEMLDEARKIAVERMVEKAGEMGANAVIDMRFATSAVMQGAAEIMAYGTAVKLKKV